MTDYTLLVYSLGVKNLFAGYLKATLAAIEFAVKTGTVACVAGRDLLLDLHDRLDEVEPKSGGDATSGRLGGRDVETGI